ncbi:family 16 glycosylhydrolase [Saccharicrinis aurantiacus]|uniref:family 16 glycosylhydrolase n=1 Tax=Saccharicrinis aurantiacus TaxID=1849719 RepID=UPI00094F6A8A|nr:family 16 glycosylhydrolase [Saccharicrinis aurantiacus]
MINAYFYSRISTLILGFILISSVIGAQPFPASDPNNEGGWQLNKYVSDEFNGTELDKTKWWILGENGDYRAKWKGRAPAQFAPHNVRVEGGELILTSQWEPDFDFAASSHKNEDGKVVKYENITQACIMSERFFKYGYMEIRCKAADAPVTCAFWTTGYQSEIDMTENYGKRPIGNPKNKPETLERKYRTNLISWDPDKAKDHKQWKNEELLDVRVAQDYYVYGFEWDKDYFNIYFNGELLKSATREELEAKDQWRHNAAQELWIDSEVFEWYGLPTMQDLADNVGEYKIDYVRVWQKELNGPYFDALGFEGPFYYSGRSANWWAPSASSWRMKNDKVASGELSLRYLQTKEAPKNQTISSPAGSLNLPAGANTLSFKIWIDEDTNVDQISFILDKPWLKLDFDISKVKKGKWLTLKKNFKRNEASDTNIKDGDRLRIQVSNQHVSGINNLFYIDDIKFEFDNTPEVRK